MFSGKEYTRLSDQRARAEYVESVWWAMHHSDDPDRRAAVVSCYLDESGTDDLSPVAAVGGLLLNKSNFFWFDVEWSKVLAKHNVTPPLHMKTFPRNMPEDKRRALFSDVSRVINDHKVVSLTATLSSGQFDVNFSTLFDKKDVIGIYGMCFVLAVVMNHKVAEKYGSQKRIPFLMDIGNNYKHHVLSAYENIVARQKAGEQWNVGSLAFDTDDLNVLQAADVISWSARRRLTMDFPKGFEPLEGIFNEDHRSPVRCST